MKLPRLIPSGLRPKPTTLLIAVSVLVATALLVVGAPVRALNFGHGTYGTCAYSSCSISLTSVGAVAVNVTPTASGSCTTQKDIVSVSTGNSSGFTLTMSNDSTNTALLKGAASLNATSGTQASPVALTVNTWGYRVDDVGGFGAGPTSAQTNVNLNATKFAGVPASGATPATLASTSTAAEPSVDTNVWYSVCANTSVASGTYTSQITYTAVAN